MLEALLIASLGAGVVGYLVWQWWTGALGEAGGRPAWSEAGGRPAWGDSGELPAAGERVRHPPPFLTRPRTLATRPSATWGPRGPLSRRARVAPRRAA